MNPPKRNPIFAMIAGDPPRLIERKLEDLGTEDWGPVAKRPWVHLSDPHQAMEKALWCYERGMVPVVTERDPALAVAIGQRYDADLLITDPESLRALAQRVREVPTLRVATVFGARSAEIEQLLAGIEVRFIDAELY